MAPLDSKNNLSSHMTNMKPNKKKNEGTPQSIDQSRDQIEDSNNIEYTTNDMNHNDSKIVNAVKHGSDSTQCESRSITATFPSSDRESSKYSSESSENNPFQNVVQRIHK